MPTSTIFDSTTRDLGPNLNPATDTLYVLLVNGYAPAPKTHSRRSDVTGEVTGTGYTAGGQALTGVTATLDTTNDWTLYTCTNPSWPASTIGSATGAVVYKHRGGLATADELVSYVDFGGAVSTTNVAFTITTFASNGFLKLTKV